MTTQTCIDPRIALAEHLETLRGYATRVVLHGETLTPGEEDDRARRMDEFLAIGEAFRLTEKEIVGLLYGQLFVPKRGCGCHSCRQA